MEKSSKLAMLTLSENDVKVVVTDFPFRHGEPRDFKNIFSGVSKVKRSSFIEEIGGIILFKDKESTNGKTQRDNFARNFPGSVNYNAKYSFLGGNEFDYEFFAKIAEYPISQKSFITQRFGDYFTKLKEQGE